MMGKSLRGLKSLPALIVRSIYRFDSIQQGNGLNYALVTNLEMISADFFRNLGPSNERR